MTEIFKQDKHRIQTEKDTIKQKLDDSMRESDKLKTEIMDMKEENHKLVNDLKYCEAEIEDIKHNMQVEEDEETDAVKEFKERLEETEKQNNEIIEINIELAEDNRRLEERYNKLLDKLKEMDKTQVQTEDICLQQAEQIDNLIQSKEEAESLLAQWKLQFEHQKNENIKLQSTVDGLSEDLQLMSHQMLDLSQSISNFSSTQLETDGSKSQTEEYFSIINLNSIKSNDDSNLDLSELINNQSQEAPQAKDTNDSKEISGIFEYIKEPMPVKSRVNSSYV